MTSIHFFFGRPGFSLVTSQFPLYCLTNFSRVVELSILKTCPSYLSLLSLIISSSFLEPVFFLMVRFWPCPSMWSPTISPGTYGELLLIFFIYVTMVDMILHHIAGLRWQVIHKAWFSPRGWYSCFSRCLLVSQIHLPLFQFLCIPCHSFLFSTSSSPGNKSLRPLQQILSLQPFLLCCLPSYCSPWSCIFRLSCVAQLFSKSFQVFGHQLHTHLWRLNEGYVICVV